MESFERAREELEGFTLEQAEIVTRVYACAQCEGDLLIAPSDFEIAFESNERYYVVCPDCGNVEQIGRISKTTVAIRNERGVFDFPKVIRTLPEYWGELIPTKAQQEQSIKELGFY